MKTPAVRNSSGPISSSDPQQTAHNLAIDVKWRHVGLAGLWRVAGAQGTEWNNDDCLPTRHHDQLAVDTEMPFTGPCGCGSVEANRREHPGADGP